MCSAFVFFVMLTHVQAASKKAEYLKLLEQNKLLHEMDAILSAQVAAENTILKLQRVGFAGACASRRHLGNQGKDITRYSCVT
jgi:hypothetical protein